MVIFFASNSDHSKARENTSPPENQTSVSNKSKFRRWSSLGYSSIEVRHNTDTFYQNSGHRDRQSPDIRLKFQLGALLYQGNVDLYMSGGIIRYPGSQQVFQERPELSVDLYPLKTKSLRIRQYHKLRLPYQKRDTEFKHYESPWEARKDQNGTIYQVGFNPWLEWPVSFQKVGMIELKSGFDFHTFMYSQPTTNKDALNNPETKKEAEKPLISNRQFASVSFKPWFEHRLLTKLSLYYESRYASQSFFDPDTSSKKSTYAVTRNASYRFRIRFSLSERVSLINDFYHYHRGFFEGRQKGDSKRFQNTLRLTTLL